MFDPHFEGAAPGLAVEKLRLDRFQEKTRLASDLVFQPGKQHAGDELVDRPAIPPTFHVGFSQTK
jgi:hypothetical protein